MGWDRSLPNQGAGRPPFHSRDGRFRNIALVFFGYISSMSAFGGKADMTRTLRNVR
jgi:hypothetical protein